MTFSEPITEEFEEAEPILGLCFQLVEVVRGILSDFENALIHKASPNNEARGTIHFLTKYVMNYIRLIVDHNCSLSRFIILKPPTCFGVLTIPDVKFAEHEGQIPLALHLVKIIVVLRFKMEAKSKNYKDDAYLVHLFMTNNLHYIIIQSIKGLPKLEEMIGEEYLNNLTENHLKQARASYEKATCERMLHCLREDEPGHLSNFIFSGVSVITLRRRIKKFNTLFEGVCSTQARWVVLDLQLREEIRLSIVEKLVPAYKSFLERYKRIVGKRKHPYLNESEKTYIKYSVEELQVLISKDFFALISMDFFAT